MFLAQVRPSRVEVEAPMPGDELLPDADVVMDRAFTVAALPESVWPWLVQLGKRRAGWYLPQRAERVLPRSRRAIRHLDPRWQDVGVGSVIPDYGGRHETFTAAEVRPPASLVYTSVRGRTSITWSIALDPLSNGRSRVRLRLRLDPVRRTWLAGTVGELLDLLTIAGMAAGLKERVEGPNRARR
jgi:hypothetical protein